MKRAIIIGATSGIGLEMAKVLLAQGWRLGIAGRRKEALETFRNQHPQQIEFQVLDVTKTDAPDRLGQLIEQVGGMDLYLHCSGIGNQNWDLNPEIELDTVHTNVEGFTRMMIAAYTYFRKQGRGHIAAISSIAGTKGLGVAPMYSASKRLQNTYIDALEQLAHMQKLDITFTDIRPGFVATALLGDGKGYPMLMNSKKVARIAVRALNRKRRVVVVDWRYALLTTFWRLIPRWLWKRLPVKNK